jgi:hypothetical protein
MATLHSDGFNRDAVRIATTSDLTRQQELPFSKQLRLLQLNPIVALKDLAQ